jgi:hypothetical protein
VSGPGGAPLLVLAPRSTGDVVAACISLRVHCHASFDAPPQDNFHAFQLRTDEDLAHFKTTGNVSERFVNLPTLPFNFKWIGRMERWINNPLPDRRPITVVAAPPDIALRADSEYRWRLYEADRWGVQAFDFKNPVTGSHVTSLFATRCIPGTVTYFDVSTSSFKFVIL